MTDFLACGIWLGFVNEKGSAIGEHEYSRMLHKESMKQHVKVIAQSLKLEGGFIGEGISSSHVHKVSKRVLHILSACALLETAEGVSLSPISIPRALGHLTDVFTTVWMRILFTVICMAIGVFMILEAKPSSSCL